MFGSKDLVWLAVISAGWLLCFGCSDPWEEQPVPDDDDIADDDDDDDDDDDSDDDDSDDDDDDSDDDDDADGGVPVATINATPMSGVAPLDVQFSGVVAGGDAPFTFYWAFGDGGEDNIVDPSYTYHLPGTFDVLFEVTDADGDVDSALVTIAVGSDDPADATPGLVINATPTAGDRLRIVLSSNPDIAGQFWTVYDNVRLTAEPIPEPVTWALLLIGAACLAATRPRSRNR